jgi:hypothetical protein
VALPPDQRGRPQSTLLLEEQGEVTGSAGPQQTPHLVPLRMNDEAVSLLRHITDLLAAGQGKNVRPKSGMPLVPTLSRKVLHLHLIQEGWLQLPKGGSLSGECNEGGGTPQKLPDHADSLGSVSDAEYKRLYKRLTSLKTKGLVGFDRYVVWVTTPAATP